MNITIHVDQRLSYREALKVAYDKARQEGTLDEITEAACLKEFNSPPPAAIYHESDMVSSNRVTESGGVYFKVWQPREIYEQARINGRVCVAQSLADKINDAADEIKDTLKAAGVELAEQDWKFSINEKGEFKPVFLFGKPDEEQESIFTKLLNENDSLRALAIEYFSMVSSVVDFTVEGRDAFYARYMAAPEK